MRRYKPYLEWKYQLSDKQVFLFKKKFSNILHKDPYSECGQYTVSTIYFDTDNFDFFQDKLEGEYYKIKIRIRSYLNDNMISINNKLELKAKVGNETVKYSSLIDEQTVNYLCTYNINIQKFLSLMPKCDKLLFDYLPKRILKPVSKLIYNRTAWFFPFIPDFRITIDNKIKIYNPKNKYFYSELSDTDNILELKSNTKIPMIFQNYLNEINAEKEAFSKYSLSIVNIYNL